MKCWKTRQKAWILNGGEFLPRLPGGCQFPKSWSGKWFQSGQQKAIVVNQTHINFKGMCIEADRESDRFLVEDKWVTSCGWYLGGYFRSHVNEWWRNCVDPSAKVVTDVWRYTKNTETFCSTKKVRRKTEKLIGEFVIVFIARVFFCGFGRVANCLPTKTVAKMTLDTICEEITGDAPLYSMFRLDAKPESCPFKGGPPFTFTYDRGYGECE